MRHKFSKKIFIKNYGRPNLLKKMRQWLIESLAMPLAVEHLGNNKKQLIVFSFDYIGLRINIDGVYELEELDTFFRGLVIIMKKYFQYYKNKY